MPNMVGIEHGPANLAVWQFLKKLKRVKSPFLAILKFYIHLYVKTCTLMFTATFFVIGKIVNNPDVNQLTNV